MKIGESSHLEPSTYRPIEGAPIPRGLSQIPDSIRPALATAPKPHIAIRSIAWLGLLVLLALTFPARIAHRIFTRSKLHETVLYSQLHGIVKKGDSQTVKHFLKNHAKNPSPTGFLFNDLLHLSELHSDLAEILQGANVCLHGDGGFFFNRWKNHPQAYKRTSSHEYQDNECYAIGHLLFWLAPNGNSHFQFEKSPLKGFFNTINHVIDYLRYRRDNEQQGPAGISRHTESYCLKYQAIDPKKFQSRISC